jgi:ATP-dependent Lhr-like helicase
MPLTTHLAARVRAILSDPAAWAALPAPVQEWLRLQRRASMLPPKDGLLVETFPRGGRWFLVAYCFEGRLAHQTLGMLVTKRMERMGMGRSATSAPTTCWRSGPPSSRPRSTGCSRRTSSARSWRSGWRRAACSAAPSATSRPSPG